MSVRVCSIVETFFISINFSFCLIYYSMSWTKGNQVPVVKSFSNFWWSVSVHFIHVRSYKFLGMVNKIVLDQGALLTYTTKTINPRFNHHPPDPSIPSVNQNWSMTNGKYQWLTSNLAKTSYQPTGLANTYVWFRCVPQTVFSHTQVQVSVFKNANPVSTNSQEHTSIRKLLDLRFEPRTIDYFWHRTGT